MALQEVNSKSFIMKSFQFHKNLKSVRLKNKKRKNAPDTESKFSNLAVRNIVTVLLIFNI